MTTLLNIEAGVIFFLAIVAAVIAIYKVGFVRGYDQGVKDKEEIEVFYDAVHEDLQKSMVHARQRPEGDAPTARPAQRRLELTIPRQEYMRQGIANEDFITEALIRADFDFSRPMVRMLMWGSHDLVFTQEIK